MKLETVTIKNFRSIQSAVIDGAYGLQILVGKNESGKTNILRAISYIDLDAPLLNVDARLASGEEDDIQTCKLSFKFKIDDDDRNALVEAALKTLLATKRQAVADSLFVLPEHKILNHPQASRSIKYLLKSYLNSISEITFTRESTRTKEDRQEYITDLPTVESIVRQANGIQLPAEWRRIRDDLPDELSPLKVNDGEFETSDHFYANIDEVDSSVELDDVFDAEYSSSRLLEDIRIALRWSFRDRLPRIVWWRYRDEDALPDRISIASFINNPQICRPLESMFHLAGITDIKARIDEVQSNPARFLSLLRNVCRRTQQHFTSVWKELPGIEFKIQPNGDHLLIGISDHENALGFAERSDGFKRFCSFLLLISARHRRGNMRDALLLLDEAENGLHPSGIRYLLDELKTLGVDNQIFAATHSVFLIDRETPERHLLISKFEEKTLVERCTTTNFSKDEVIFQALGTSLYEFLKLKNVLFEGMTDFRLFEQGCKLLKAIFPEELQDLKGFQISYLQGAPSITQTLTTLRLGRCMALVVGDGDHETRRAQKEFDDLMDLNDWVLYPDAVHDAAFQTAEDFITDARWVDILKKVLSIAIPGHAEKATGLVNQHVNHPRMEALGKLIEKIKAPAGALREVKRELKYLLFEDLKKSDIDEKYTLVLSKIIEKAQKMNKK